MLKPCFAALAALLASACATPLAPPPPFGSKYVAMGSSFAAGPGIATYAEDPAGPCFRSTQNYGHQIARRHALTLADVGCSGGVTAHLLGPRGAIPAQLDAVTADTRLVTITIGGNDLNYMTRLTGASCIALAPASGVTDKCPAIPDMPTEADYAGLAERMNKIVAEVRRRAPAARLVFVDYLAVLPATGLCPGTPLAASEADLDREIARRLAAITAKAAADGNADLIKASRLSVNHDACSAAPWMNGYPRPGAPVAGAAYHPNQAGMTAIAEALDRLIWR
jgi:lysophospholipase L1-like esterase